MQIIRPIAHWTLIVLGFLMVPVLPVQAATGVQLTHVHGLSYSDDGRRIMIPSHHGLAVYANGRWSMAPGPAHDFMGFSATRDAMYSSGHPAPGTGLINPFGLIKSLDGGKTWSKLGLEGESDFHVLATSYGTNAVYVLNHAANSRMNKPGIFYTRNDGLQWLAAPGKGLDGEPRSLAVHPEDPGIVAVGTATGLFLSRDFAANFQRLASGYQVLGQAFDLDGQHLWFSAFAGKPLLMRIKLEAGAEAQTVNLPPLKEDAVAYIAQNPARRQEMAIATFKRNVYLSRDAGRNWQAIAIDGVTRQAPKK